MKIKIQDKLSIEVANCVTAYFLKRGSLPYSEKDDFKQEILLKYIKQKKQIINNYRGESQLKTYLTATFFNFGREYIRREARNWVSNNPSFTPDEADERSPQSSLIIKEEIKRLKLVIMLFADEAAKTRLFLKCYYRMLVLIQDLSEYEPSFIKLEIDKLLLGKEFTQNSEIYETLSEVSNRVENKKNKPDAVRMWIKKRIGQIIYRLDGKYHSSNYSEETVGILMEYMCEEQTKEAYEYTE
ncbi:MAG: sigma-70 family RNA polymerase sigma factor [Bacteroidales bacterium]|nr:sigma-70 family RNA polymerase sigma factor [Bacteroidales bacterium]